MRLPDEITCPFTGLADLWTVSQPYSQVFKAEAPGTDEAVSLCRGSWQYQSFICLRASAALPGRGQDNRIQGAIYLRRAAEQGDAKAAYQVAKLLEEGYPGMTVDFAAALAFYQQAAEQGHVLAIKRLVEVYWEGGLNQAADSSRLAYWQELQQRYSPRE